MDIRIFPPEEMIDGKVALPFSKSCANRAMIIDRLAGVATPEPDQALNGTDTTNLWRILSAPLEGTIDVADAGTSMRFLTALCAATEGVEVTLTGTQRMLERPVGPLVDALRRCGAEIEYAGRDGFPPLNIRGRRLSGDMTVEVDATVSSQFVSALLMVAPTMEGGLKVDLEGPVKSRPYIALTIHMMEQRGISVDVDGTMITVHPGAYNAGPSKEEADWSALAFWAELTAVTAGFIFVPGVDRESAQGDRRVIEIFSQLGVAFQNADEADDEDSLPAADGEGLQLCGSPELTPRLIYNFTECPDLAQAAVVTCCMIGVPFHLTGLSSLAIKETDRVTALIEEMDRLGLKLSSAAPGSLDWEGERRPVHELPAFDSHGDHRTAMSLAAVAAFIPGITIHGAECVSKSYPGFWQQLEALGFKLTDAAEPYDPTAQED
ncbi:MAG: hypothetical protein NC336_09850 [Clostridium sp.]|nr:hypothetical protein [Clostridium sp.]